MKSVVLNVPARRKKETAQEGNPTSEMIRQFMFLSPAHDSWDNNLPTIPDLLQHSPHPLTSLSQSTSSLNYIQLDRETDQKRRKKDYHGFALYRSTISFLTFPVSATRTIENLHLKGWWW